jgi:hypothetical protein
VTEVFLDVAFVDLGRRGEPGAQRMPGKLLLPVSLGQIAAHARCDRQAFARRATWRSLRLSDPTSRLTTP